VFLFCFSSSCVLYIACFSGLQCNLFYTFLWVHLLAQLF
jgi:hypothetical protein